MVKVNTLGFVTDKQPIHKSEMIFARKKHAVIPIFGALLEQPGDFRIG
jgi:hypothetical protein